MESYLSLAFVFLVIEEISQDEDQTIWNKIFQRKSKDRLQINVQLVL